MKTTLLIRLIFHKLDDISQYQMVLQSRLLQDWSTASLIALW